MSRSGYSDSCDGWALIRWRGAVKSALRGERGQRFLRDLAAAMDAMPDKRLGRGAFQSQDGCLCTLGVVAAARGMDLKSLDQMVGTEVFEHTDGDGIAREFGLAAAMVKEIMYMNDDGLWWSDRETPEGRWERMRQWVEGNIHAPAAR